MADVLCLDLLCRDAADICFAQRDGSADFRLARAAVGVGDDQKGRAGEGVGAVQNRAFAARHDVAGRIAFAALSDPIGIGAGEVMGGIRGGQIRHEFGKAFRFLAKARSGGFVDGKRHILAAARP